ncbi:xanthine dehydrogenase small subunit [Aestuariicella hydrocarbonica]|uniref:Xanthine dehydrogenase small subunit n=2 Tax=Pseudomaricurvus hydrocarbonicus TaxID=1470433 RepID=A0A9E5JVH6_9GAMM|nr:xanthine dehydrogenase small subunit [Aestuariicella hydrocarbonica]
MIEFLLNGEPLRITDEDPNCTLLDFLRDRLHHTGSKEGCASGDCGACTAALGELDGETIHYKSINTCITPLGNVHGKHLVTVEELKQGQQLHPAQQAMVDCHGSQCGFCTPGFVMSLFVLGRDEISAPDRHRIEESLGGNLCRCTGYRPIIEAAVQMFDPALQAERDPFTEREAEWVKVLQSMNRDQDVELSGGGHHYVAPATSARLAQLLQHYPAARLVAGGTDLALELTQQLCSIDTLIYTGRVREMIGVSETDTHLIIGAAASYNQFGPALTALYPECRELLERLGSRQIRNQGTLGGNIGNASPIGDMPPLLLALGASLRLRGAERVRELPLEQFFLGYKRTALQAGEFIEAILVPRPAPGDSLRVYKISKRFEDDISSSCGAFLLSLDQQIVTRVRVAFGGMDAIPRRALECEQALLGKPLDDVAIAAAMAALARDFTPISDFRASSDYRLQVSQNLLKRLQLELNSPSATLLSRVNQHA